MAISDIEIGGYGLEEDLPLLGFSMWNIIVFLLVLVIGFVVIKIVTSSTRKALLRMNIAELLANFLIRMLRILLYIFLVGIALSMLGVAVGAALVSISIVLGFVLGFALGDILGSIAAGFMIAITKPFKKDDYVTVNGESGVVRNVGISITELDTPDNKHLVIPNKSVWGSNIINFTRNPTRRIDMTVGVSYGDDLDKVIKLTYNILTLNPKVLKDPAPRVAVNDMGDSSVNLVIRPWVNTEDYWDVYFELQKTIKQSYDKNGISIPFPQMDVHLEGEK